MSERSSVDTTHVPITLRPDQAVDCSPADNSLVMPANSTVMERSLSLESEPIYGGSPIFWAESGFPTRCTTGHIALRIKKEIKSRAGAGRQSRDLFSDSRLSCAKGEGNRRVG